MKVLCVGFVEGVARPRPSKPVVQLQKVSRGVCSASQIASSFRLILWISNSVLPEKRLGSQCSCRESMQLTVGHLPMPT